MATTTAERTSATPEEIWAIIRETQLLQKKWQAEAKQRQEEYEARQKDADERWARERDELNRKFAETKELFDRTDRKIEANNGEMGRLRNSFGEVIEHLVAPGIKERFAGLGLDFSSGKIAANMVVSDGGKDVAEADLWLENGETVLVVEVKAKVKAKDVSKHMERLEKIRGAHDRCNDRRRIVGAIAGAVFGPGQREAALEAGFFVIAQSGDTMRMDIPDGFKPREW